MTCELQAFSTAAPLGAISLLQELGTGDSGFGGTEFGAGELDLVEYLRRTISETEPANLAPGRVPQTTFWIVTDGGAVGILRMRHTLNDATRVKGGHIGYYIRPSARRRGLATTALQLALGQIRRVGVTNVMLTTNPSNLGSIRVIEENGGVLKAQVPSPDGGEATSQYWIALA